MPGRFGLFEGGLRERWLATSSDSSSKGARSRQGGPGPDGRWIRPRSLAQRPAALRCRISDRAVGRKTAAVLLPPRGNALFVAGCSALETALVVGSAAAGVAPWWFPLVMAPVIALRVRQWIQGFVRGEILLARRLGIHLHRLCCALLLTVDLAAAGLLTGGRA